MTNPPHDMFCPGTAYLPNGQLLVNGGSSSPETTIYDPLSSTWSSDAEMNVRRGYNASVLLSNGSVFTIGGGWAGAPLADKIGELWAPGQGWRRLVGISAQPITGPDKEDANDGFVYRGDNHAWLFAVRDGRVFHAGPSAEMHWITTEGDGTIVSAGNRADDPYSMNGNAVLYDIGLIFKTGGAPAYTSGPWGNAVATTNTYVIDINAAIADPQNPVVVRRTAPMTFARTYANAVVLPTGQILVVGGQPIGVTFTDTNAVLTPELWDPATNPPSFRELADMQTPRVYHSVALLLSDGRVFVGGGGQCGTCPTNHPNAEIFSPPYLFAADGTLAARPAITDAPSAGTLGQTITVTATQNLSSFALIRLSVVTHSTNNDQRRIPLGIQSQPSAGQYVLAIPADPGTVPLGYYMLFAIDANGVPSQGSMIRIGVPSGGDIVTGLIHEWPMTDIHVSGTTVSDVIGNVNGTINGGVTSGAGPGGRTARVFDGSTGYISLPATVYDWNSGPFTVAMWVWVNDNTAAGGGGQPQAYFYNDLGGGAANDVYYTANRVTPNSGGIDFVVNGQYWTSPAGVVPSGTWTHIGFTSSAGGVGGTKVGYVSGSPVELIPHPGDATYDTAAGNIGSGIATQGNLAGRIHELRIYNRALSAADMSTLSTTTVP